MCLVGFSGLASGEWQLVAANLPLASLVWAGIRFGTRGAVTFSFATLTISAVATSQGLGVRWRSTTPTPA